MSKFFIGTKLPYVKDAKAGEDSGYDLQVPHDIVCLKGTIITIDHEVHVAHYANSYMDEDPRLTEICEDGYYMHDQYMSPRSRRRAFLLMPRSSIWKTPLRLCNSIGLIDATYNGPLIAKVDVFEDFTILAGTKLFQIVAADLTPCEIIATSVEFILSQPSKRGSAGFGSTS